MNQLVRIRNEDPPTECPLVRIGEAITDADAWGMVSVRHAIDIGGGVQIVKRSYHWRDLTPVRIMADRRAVIAWRRNQDAAEHAHA